MATPLAAKEAHLYRILLENDQWSWSVTSVNTLPVTQYLGLTFIKLWYHYYKQLHPSKVNHEIDLVSHCQAATVWQSRIHWLLRSATVLKQTPTWWCHSGSISSFIYSLTVANIADDIVLQQGNANVACVALIYCFLTSCDVIILYFSIPLNWPKNVFVSTK